jgi:hypothetical protein
MGRGLLGVLLTLLFATVTGAVEQPERQEIPSTVVRAYLQALRDGNYDQTYEYLSTRFRNGMSREEWIGQLRRQAIMPRSKVLSMRVNPAIVRGEEATVVASFRLETPAGRKVSRETYTLIKEQGHWRIDGIKVIDAPPEK